jgi:hypothetical protein
MGERMFKNSFTILFLLASGAGRLSAADESDQRSGINRPVTSQEIDQLKQDISDSSSSNVQGIFEYHAENGDLNNRLDFLRYGGQINFRWNPDTVVYFRATHTSYLTIGGALDEHGFNGTGGVRTSLSEAVDLQVEAGYTRFSTDSSTVNALGTLRYKASSGSTLYATASRTNVEESLLSATGIRPIFGPFAGQLVGQVMDNRAVGGGLLKLTRRFDISAEGGGGARTGHKIDTNGFRTVSAGAAFNLIADSEESSLSLVRASYGLDYYGFDEDLFGYGGASLSDRRGRPIPIPLLGADGISPLALPGHPGVGGYFSPQAFVSNVGRLELRGRLHPNVQYDVSGFVGKQDYTGSPARLANGFFGSVTLRLSDRFSIPVSYGYDNVGPYTQQSLLARLAVKL